MARLGVNIDHIATLRQARKTPYPDIVEAAVLSIKGGADQITVHLREDRRHIQDGDLPLLKRTINVPLNIEMAAVDEITNIACAIRPAMVTLVPERRQELTTEGGLNLGDFKKISFAVDRLKKSGIAVSLFINPDVESVKTSHKLGIDAVELHTGIYCEAKTDADLESELARLHEAASLASSLKLNVAAGHGLHYENMRPLVEKVPAIMEYNIGHAIVARAVFTGLEKAVHEMKVLLLN